MLKKSLSLMVALFLATAPSHGAEAQDGATILTISFANDAKPAVDLTMGDLMELPMSKIETATPWHDGVQVFEGVALSELMSNVEASGEMLRVEALNGYESELPFSDFVEHGPLLAYRLNGKEMSVAEKGPLFIIYPFDSRPELNTEQFFSRSAWQVRSMAVE